MALVHPHLPFCIATVVTTHAWSIVDTGVAGECRYLVGKARNSTWCHIRERERGGAREVGREGGGALFSHRHSYYEETVQCQHKIFWPQSEDSLLAHCKVEQNQRLCQQGPPVLIGTSTSNQTCT
jgi:hypothetical protein